MPASDPPGAGGACVSWRGQSSGSRSPEPGCRKCAGAFSSPVELTGKLRLGVELRLLGCAEAVLPLQLRKMSDSEDSNFSEEEDSERSSEAEEAEVSDLDSRGRRCAWGRGQGREAPARAQDSARLGGFQIVGRDGRAGNSEWSRETGSGRRGCTRVTETVGDVFRLHWLFSIMCLICFILLIIIICGVRIESRALVMLGRHSVVELQFFMFLFLGVPSSPRSVFVLPTVCQA